MKKKIFLVMSAMLVFGLAIVVYSAVTATDLSTTVAACCCCHGDSCPMKQKSADGKETASCCQGGGESCPMMKKDAAASTATATTVKNEGETSCPMMKKDADGKPMKMDNADATAMHMKHHMNKDGKSCDCSCCHKTTDKESKDAPQV